MADVTAEPINIQPTSSPVTGSLQPPAEAPTPAPTPQPAAIAPAKAGSVFHNVSHALMGGIIGSLAGQPQSTYDVNDAGTMQANPHGPDKTGDKLRRIFQSALIGLTAGSKEHGGLAGMGAGAEASMQNRQQQDLGQRKQAEDEYNREQQAILRKYAISELNSRNLTNYYANLKAGNDLNPTFTDNKTFYEAAKLSPELGAHVQELGDAEVEQAIADPNSPISPSSHVVLPLGRAPVMGPDGLPLKKADGGFESKMRFAVIDGGKDGKISVTPAMAKDFQDYGGMIPTVSGSLKNVKAGDEIPFADLLYGLGKVTEAKNKVLQGWQDATLAWQPDPQNPKREIPVLVNGFDPSLTKPATAIPSSEKKIQSEIDENRASAEASRASAREHLANAALLASSIGTGPQGATDPAIVAELSKTVGQLNPAAQASIRGLPLETVKALLTLATGDARLTEIFPTRNYRLAGGITSQHAIGIARIINPGFNTGLAPAKADAMKRFGSGKEGQSVRSFNMFLSHAADAKDVSNEFDRNSRPIINKPMNILRRDYQGDPRVNRLLTAISAAREEWNTMIKGGFAPTKDESENAQTLMSDTASPQMIEAVLEVMGHQGLARLDALNEEWKQLYITNQPNLVTPAGRNAAIRLGLGEDVAKYSSGGTFPGVMSPTGQAAAAPSGPPAGASGTAMGSDGKKHYHDAQGNDLGVAQ